MPDENAIVGQVTNIDPPLARTTAEDLLRENEDGVEIQLGDEESVRLTPGEAAAGTLEILEELRQMRHPAYLEIDPDARVVTRLRIPLVTRIEDMRELGADVRIRLTTSHAVHSLDRSTEDFDELHAAVTDALASGAPQAVTETDDHRIIDVRPWPHPPFPPEPIEVVKPSNPLLRIWEWIKFPFCWLWWFFHCVPPARAEQLFDQMNAQSCDPLTVPVPCIPFLYPDNGCWARAHEMCRLMQLQAARPRKIWIDGYLQTPTRNHPNCMVIWGWHVAPTLCVRQWWPFYAKKMVIDPSLFDEPVTVATWKAAQGDPSATLTPSDASLYWRNYMPTDPGYVDTNQRLAYYRLQLKNRSLLPGGPPPYAACP